MSGIDNIAKLFAGNQKSIRIRQATVVATHAGPPKTIDLQIAGSSVTVFGVPTMSHVTGVVGQSVWVMINGHDVFVFGATVGSSTIQQFGIGNFTVTPTMTVAGSASPIHGAAALSANPRITVAGFVTAPGAKTTVYGVSHGDSILLAVDPNIIRTYTASQRSDANATGLPQHLSYKPSGNSERTLVRNNDAGEKTTVKAYAAAMLDVPGCEFTYDHERNNDDKTTGGAATNAANYQAEWVNIIAWIDEVNLTRTNPILTTPTTTGALYTDSYTTPDAWHIAGADKHGVDIYVHARIANWASYYAAKNVPWSIPEWGGETGTAGQTDAQMQAAMISDSTTVAGLSNPPSPMMWYNQSWNQITRHSDGSGSQNNVDFPLSVAELKALCDASA